MVCNQFQGCLVVIQQGGPDTWYNWGGPAKVGARKSFLFTESSVVVKKKNIIALLKVQLDEFILTVIVFDFTVTFSKLTLCFFRLL